VALTRTSRLLGCGSFLLLIGLVASCTSLDDIELGVCGNGVLDPSEDCDGHEKNGAACGEPGTANACRYLCDFASEAPVCPDAEYRCGATNVCARAGEGLLPGATFDRGGEAVVVADFDGDKIADLGIANTATRELVVSFLGPGSSIELEQRIAIDSTLIATPRLQDAERADLVTTSEGSLVSFSSAPSERSLVGNASALVPIDIARLIGIPARALKEEAAKDLLEPDTVVGGVLVPNDGGFTEVYLQNPFSFGVDVVATIDAKIVSADVAALLKARFYPVPDGKDPCDELLLLRSDNRSFTVLQMCLEGEHVLENAACDGGACIQTVSLAEEPVNAFALQLDDDPEAEIVVVERDADGDLTLETLDGGTLLPEASLVDAQLWLDALLESGWSDGVPILAVDFINADADLDFVRADGVYLSEHLLADPLAPPTYFQAAEPSAGQWVEALVGDFGGDERPDVVASSGTIGDGIELRIGTSASYMNGATVALAGAAGQLTSGDFDGDGVLDVVFRERPANDPSAIPSCDVIDSVVVRYGARGPDVLGDARVLSRVSGLEDIVAGALPRSDTRDSISDFATASRCATEDGSPALADISLFYGAVNRQVVAPKVLLDNRDVGETQNIVPYTPTSVASFPGAPFVVALGEDRFQALPDTNDDLALFVLSPKDIGLVTGLLEGQAISLLGGEAHADVAISEYRIAIAALADPETPAVIVVDPLHIHVVEGWRDLPDASDKQGAATIESFPSVEMPGDGALTIDFAFGGDVTGDGLDDLIVAGVLDGVPVLRVHSDLSGNAASFVEIASDGLGAGVLAVALLPREGLAASADENVDLVLALAGEGAVVVRFDGEQFTVVESLPFPQITTLAVGDVDGDQFADVVLVAQDRASVFVRTQRFAGDDAAASTEAGDQ
jgi:hypothetical protein